MKLPRFIHLYNKRKQAKISALRERIGEVRIVKKFTFIPTRCNDVFVWLEFVYIEYILTENSERPEWVRNSYVTEERYNTFKNKPVDNNPVDNKEEVHTKLYPSKLEERITKLLTYLQEYKTELDEFSELDGLEIQIALHDSQNISYRPQNISYSCNSGYPLLNFIVFDSCKIEQHVRLIESEFISSRNTCNYLHVVFISNNYIYGHYSFHISHNTVCIPHYIQQQLPDANGIADNINKHHAYIDMINNVFNKENGLVNNSNDYSTDSCFSYKFGWRSPKYSGCYEVSTSHFINFELQKSRFDKLDFITYNSTLQSITFTFDHKINSEELLSKINTLRDYVTTLFESEQKMLRDYLKSIYAVYYVNGESSIIYAKDSVLTEKKLAYVDLFTGLHYSININQNVNGIVEDDLSPNKHTLLPYSHFTTYGDDYFMGVLTVPIGGASE